MTHVERATPPRRSNPLSDTLGAKILLGKENRIREHRRFDRVVFGTVFALTKVVLQLSERYINDTDVFWVFAIQSTK